MLVSLIVAVAANGVIGRDGHLPWRIPTDLRFFKEKTMGKPVVMGRKTFQSIGRALPGRRNIVLTRDARFTANDVLVAHDLDEALASVSEAGEVMIIGGAEVYLLALPRADRIYLTKVKLDADGDTYFPTLDYRAWSETACEDHPAEGDAPAFSFVTLER